LLDRDFEAVLQTLKTVEAFIVYLPENPHVQYLQFNKLVSERK
jgi:hypothetical protein